MAQVYRERDVRYTRERSRSSSGDERHYTTTRYKVTGGSATTTRLDRYDDDDDRVSRHSHSYSRHRPAAEIVQIDRHPDRPRSALDAQYRGDEHHRTVTVDYDREVERERDYYVPERHSRTRVYEESEHLSPTHDKYWERRGHDHHDFDIDVHFDKRVVRRGSDNELKLKEKIIDIRKDDHREESRDYKDIKVERRVVEARHPRDDEYERYHREVEYYTAPDPPQANIVIRQKMPEQKVIVHEAAPVIVERPDPTVIVLREEKRDRRDEEDYRRRHDERRYEHDDRRYEHDSYDEDYYEKKTVIRRDRSSSSSGHHKLRIAQGALAGAGITALVNRRGKDDEPDEYRGRKILAGAALGALGTEVIRRARSAYDDKHDEYEYEEDDRHRHRSKSRGRLNTGLAVGAAALAVAGGLKLMQDGKEEKDEGRGRSRHRHPDEISEHSVSRSRHHHSHSHSHSHHHSHSHGHHSKSHSHHHSHSKSKSNAAKVGAATAAVAGVAHHYRSKSRGKSKSRVKTGAEIAAAGLTGAAATKIWEHHQDKKHRDDSDSSDDEYHSRHQKITVSRSRSLGRHHHSRESSADRQLGMVRVHDIEYGSEPLESHDSASEAPRRRRSKREHREASRHDEDRREKRSKSKLRDVAVAGLGTGVAALGMKKYAEYQKNKERAEQSRERSPEASRSRERHGVAREHRSRERERRQYEESVTEHSELDLHIEAPIASPPLASGGFPVEDPKLPPPRPVGYNYTRRQSVTNNGRPYVAYNPQDYVSFPPPPPRPEPALRSYSPPPGGPGYHSGPEHVSQHPTTNANRSHPDVSRSPTDDQVLTGQSEDGIRQPSTTAMVRRRAHSLDTLRNAQHDPSDENEVVDLPIRFDSTGRPLDVHHRRRRRPRSSRGEFEIRPRHSGDMSMHGEWATFQTGDYEDVMHVAQTLSDMLARRRGVIGFLGHMLKDRLAQ